MPLVAHESQSVFTTSTVVAPAHPNTESLVPELGTAPTSFDAQPSLGGSAAGREQRVGVALPEDEQRMADELITLLDLPKRGGRKGVLVGTAGALRAALRIAHHVASGHPVKAAVLAGCSRGKAMSRAKARVKAAKTEARGVTQAALLDEAVSFAKRPGVSG